MKFEDSLERKYNEYLNAPESSTISAYRHRAFSNFKSMGFPTRKNEDWKYTSVQSVREAELAIQEYAEEPDRDLLKALKIKGTHTIVLVNGQCREDLSDKKLCEGLAIKSLQNEELAKFVASVSKPESHENAFSYLNQAFSTHLTLLEVSAAMNSVPKVHIIHVSTQTASGKASFNNPRLYIRLAEQAGLNLIESFVGDDQASFCNSLTDMDLGPASSIKHLRIFGEGQEALHIGATRWHQQRNSTVDSTLFSYGGKLLRHDLHLSLNEEGCFSTHKGLYLARGEQHVDHHSWLEHRVGNCQTQQHYKGILDEKARGVFSGKVIIHKNAQKADSQQLNNNLILSRGAEVDSKPELEVYADDVKATHGSTTGQLSEDEVLYLQTRGISRVQAIQMISQGFAMDLMLTIEPPEAREYCVGLVMGALQGLHIEGAYNG